MRPPVARQTARNSIGAIVLPVASRIHGTTFCAMNPPRLPTELIAARPAAAEAPVRNFDGRLHSTGCGQKIPAAATHRNANRNVLLGAYTLSARQAAPISAGATMNGVSSPDLAAKRGLNHRANATITHGMMLM